MAHLVNDRRGAVSIQIALFLPILIVILVGAFEVWKVMYLQQVLNDAAYQAVRLLVTQANAPSVEGLPERDMHREAEMMVRRYVATQAYAPTSEDVVQDEVYHMYAPDYAGIEVDIITDEYPPRCGSQVTVTVRRYWVVGRGSTQNRGGWLPFLGRGGWLSGTARGMVQCEREEDVTGGP